MIFKLTSKYNRKFVSVSVLVKLLHKIKVGYPTFISQTA